MTSDQKVIVCGDSHILAMGVPKTRLKYRLTQIEGLPGVYGVARRSQGKIEKYYKFIRDNLESKILLLSWQGNQHNSGFFVLPSPFI